VTKIKTILRILCRQGGTPVYLREPKGTTAKNQKGPLKEMERAQYPVRDRNTT